MSDLIPPLALRPEHMPRGQLFADREDMVRAFRQPTDKVGEIGVALGGFSKPLIAAFRPRLFVPFDLFELHKGPTVWNRTSQEVFGEGTHLDYYLAAIATDVCQIAPEVGMSHERLATHADASFDVLYIDGDHGYPQVRRDAEQAVRALKPDGLLIFNDYVIVDTFGRENYGVVPVVNALVAEGGWQVVGLALHQFMYCDIALRRARP